MLGEGTREGLLMSMWLLLGAIKYFWNLVVAMVALPYEKVHIMYSRGGGEFYSV